jgi:hypothetical protein
MGLAYFQDAEAEAFRAQIAGSHGDAVEALCRAHELFARGSSLVEPVNPSTEAALLAEQKRIGNLIVKVRDKVKKSC